MFTRFLRKQQWRFAHPHRWYNSRTIENIRESFEDDVIEDVDDLVIDDSEESINWAPLTRLEKRERTKIISKAERQAEQDQLKMPDATGFYFRNFKIPSSPVTDPLQKYVLTDAEYLFSLPSDIIASCAAMHELPDLKNVPEVAIAGRSNVGKSSFINALLGRDLCTVSQTPGRTRRLNYFNVGRYMYLVDLPGYGFAKGNKQKIENYNELLVEYCNTRPNLKRVFVLIDARHGFFESDVEFLDKITKRATVQIVLTKCDLINIDQLFSLTKQILAYVEEHYPLVFPVITPTSSSKLEGMDQARGWVYASTGLPERLALLNSVNSAKSLSLREEQNRISLSQINPDHPIIANQKTIPEEVRQAQKIHSISKERRQDEEKQREVKEEKEASGDKKKKKQKKKVTKKVIEKPIEDQKFKGQYIVGLDDFYN